MNNQFFQGRQVGPVGPLANVRNVDNKNIMNNLVSAAQNISLGLLEPSVDNPMMNPTIISYDRPQVFKDYYRYDKTFPSPKTEEIRKEVSEDLMKNLYRDPADLLFDRNNSQRQWFSTPVGSIPSEQNRFANWLYGVENVCKSGSIWSRYPVAYTDDSLVCNGNNAAEPSNFGNLS